MPTRGRNARSVAIKSAELSMAVPAVVAHRLTRLALGGPHYSRQDRKEFGLMVNEKMVASMQSWQAMLVQAWRVHQAWSLSLLRLAWSPVAWERPRAPSAASRMQHAFFGILDKGMAPINRKAMANARRLSRAKIR